jgi:hypothetical protein
VNNEKGEIVFFCELMKIVSTNVAVVHRLGGFPHFGLAQDVK